MGKELEYKLRAQNMPELTEAYERVKAAAAAGTERNIEMFTRYYDTPEGLLRARRWTLRIRQENDRQMLTCKTPDEGHARGEWELVRQTDAPAPAPEELRSLAEMGAPQLLCELRGLEQICGARFIRRCVMLTLPDARIELAADTGELFGTEKRQSFCELELELYGGSERRLAELAKLAGLPEEPLSKQARALALLQFDSIQTGKTVIK